ncbi:hypothetical protein [Photorhabdus hainanensis]|nr:hypothetical protein [Photorhabdus hainanensis]
MFQRTLGVDAPRSGALLAQERKRRASNATESKIENLDTPCPAKL